VDGTELRDCEEILVADEPEDFAQALIDLYQSEKLWSRLSENGIRKTRALYSADAARKKLEFLFSEDHLKGWVRSTEVPQIEIMLAANSCPGSNQ
jgi:glycosyltransferase involved in cell wall biosynthesis